ncbi:MAG: glycosyltransferase family 4 protein [Alistipes sp.]|nr:glycosyltransferase family 4 protein [Alistipes sp.]
MNILFSLISYPVSTQSRDMYSDLVCEFVKNGHNVTVIAPSNDNKTSLSKENGIEVLRVKTIPFVWQKKRIYKGLSMVVMPYSYKWAYRKHLNDRSFDWVIMPTPSITLIDFAHYVKKKTDCKIYLILRDIHPQSSASLGEIRSKILIKYLDSFSHKAYKIATIVGCMSQMNIDYVCSLYDDVTNKNFRILYNWIAKPSTENLNNQSANIRNKFNLGNKFIALFGGNIGTGQRIENIEMLASHFIDNDDIRFVIIGKGVKCEQFKLYCKEHNLHNVIFIDYMPTDEYLSFVSSVDVGLVSINENNAAPTCPSKAVSYMALKIPIFAMINNSDYGKVYIEDSGAGIWCIGGNQHNICAEFQKLYDNRDRLKQMGEAGYKFFNENLTVSKIFQNIIEQMSEND